MARLHAHRRDLRGLRRTVAYVIERGCEVDLLSRNRALAACCNAGALELAEAILNCSELCPDGSDAVAYNTLMKGYACVGRPARCFELYEEMHTAGVAPSEMTYGILLNTCNSAGEHQRARKVFEDLCASGVPLNVVHYTTFMKGLVSAGHLDDAAAVLRQMESTDGVAPDLVAYSMLVKAHADSGNVMEAMRLLEQMRRHGIEPDAVVLNIVLGGCYVRRMEPGQVLLVLDRLMGHGLHPSTVTLSILIKALVRSEAFEEGLRMLETAPETLGVAAPEARLFAQLAQAAGRAGRGPMALAVYAAMVKVRATSRHAGGACSVGEAGSSRLLQICAAAGQAEPARRLHRAVVEAHGRPRAAAAARLLAAADAAADAAAAAAWEAVAGKT